MYEQVASVMLRLVFLDKNRNREWGGIAIS